MKSRMSFLRSPGTAFWYAARPFRWRLSAMYFCVITGNIASYSVSYFFKIIADRIAGAPWGTLVFTDFVPVLVLASIVVASQEFFFRIGHVVERTIVIPMYDRITSTLYQTLLERPAAYFEERFSGELSRRIEQIASSQRYFVEYFPWDIGWQVIGGIVTAVLLFVANPILTEVFLAWLVVFLIISFFLVRQMSKHTQTTADKQGDLSGTIVDVLGNVSVVQAFAAQGHEYTHYRRFMDAALAAEHAERFWGIINKLWQGSSVVVLNVLLLITSVWLYTEGKTTIGDFVIVAAAIPTFAGIIWNLGDTVLRIIRSHGEMKSALEALRTDAKPIKETSKTLVVTEPRIEFAHVSFSYPGSPERVLNDFSLAIQPGEKVGFVGRSGAGKSTVVRLLLHSYDAQKGAIRVSGQDVTGVSLQSLRQHIAFVPQDTALFHRTLYENILYARPDATRDDVLKASTLAHAHDFIEELPNGYDTLVGERGIKLSGGQRQRVAIARAILKNAPILVLDEATSALDSESESVVQDGLHLLFENRTVIAIAHRLSTLRLMDRIIVLEHGHIVEDGAPHELLTKEGGVFREMWEHQKKGFI